MDFVRSAVPGPNSIKLVRNIWGSKCLGNLASSFKMVWCAFAYGLVQLASQKGLFFILFCSFKECGIHVVSASRVCIYVSNADAFLYVLADERALAEPRLVFGPQHPPASFCLPCDGAPGLPNLT